MLAEFNIDKKIYADNREKLFTSINSLGKKVVFKNIDSLDSLVKETDWFVQLKIEDLKMITLAMTSYDNLLSIVIKGREKLIFKYDDHLKKVFILQMGDEYESDVTINTAINSLIHSESYEVKIGKSVKDFNEDEIKEYLIDSIETVMYHKLRNRTYIISKFQKFYSTYLEYPFNWSEFQKPSKLIETVGREAKEYMVTRKDLLNLTGAMKNIQESIIPLLIFEGLNLSKVEELDEVRFLRKEDLNGNEITVRDGDGNVKRAIEIENDIAQKIDLAIEAEYNIRISKHIDYYVEIENTDYVVRSSINAKKKKNNTNADAISFRGAYDRVKKCKEQFEATMFEINFTPNQIRTFGKMYYVSKFKSEGYDLLESCRLTLKRFGEWNVGEDKATKSSNSQLVNRMKNVWLLYN